MRLRHSSCRRVRTCLLAWGTVREAVRGETVSIWRSLDEVDAQFARGVVLVGNFDGVHRGHQALVHRAREVADARKAPLVAVIFDPHPMAVLRPQHAPSTLSPVEVRARLLHESGVDAVLVLPFDVMTAQWSPVRFVDTVLARALRAAVVVVGANFRFGRRAAGDVRVLRELGSDGDFEVESVVLEGGPQVWSASYVRVCLAAGDVTGATEALGRPFSLRGTVVGGDRRGRQLGFPTANVPADNAASVPADGVYAGWLTRTDTGESWPAAISVGTNPTFGTGLDRRIESYVLDRDDLDLYGVEVEVAFVSRIRGMVAFDSGEALVHRMRLDVEQCRQILAAEPLLRRKGA
jgi:riboflavin kinase/FMN adenylyltransferase